MEKIIECVPNFSEGRDMGVIKQITDAIEAVEGAKLLDVDPGKATNRTVVTFVGAPEAVIEAAFQAIKKAAEVIDMREHQGEHPRMGATDVCPLIPISGVTMEEAAECARKIGKRVGEELDIPVYLYEDAATTPERRNLATAVSPTAIIAAVKTRPARTCAAPPFRAAKAPKPASRATKPAAICSQSSI